VGAVGEPDPGEAAVIGLDAGDRAFDDRDAERAELFLLAGALRGSPASTTSTDRRDRASATAPASPAAPPPTTTTS
jgi:hypothetical protein